MKKSRKTPFALAMGASLLPFAANVAQAESNPFALMELSSAYMQTAEAATPAIPPAATDKAKSGSCGEGKCGASMKMDKGAEKKAVEKKCAANMPAAPAAGQATTPDAGSGK
jgi:uncharacterized low-complexity protein